jgi:hypothetical protein
MKFVFGNQISGVPDICTASLSMGPPLVIR